MTNRHLTWALLAIASVTGLAVALGTDDSPPAPRAPAPGVAPAAVAASGAPTAGVGSLLVPLPTRERALDVDARFVIQLGGNEHTLAIAGRWTLTGLVHDGPELVVRGELVAAVTRDGVADDRLAGELARAHQLTFGTDGAIQRFEFEPAEDGTARGLVRSLATATQLVAGPGDHWDATERDAYGDYSARYAREMAGLVKRKLRYTKPREGLLVRALEGEVRFTTAAVAADERIAFDVAGVAFGATARIELRDRGERAGALVAARPGLVRVGVADAADDAAGDRALADGATVADLIAELATATDDDAIGALALRLRAVVRATPGAAAELAAQIRTGGELVAGVGAGVLGSAGTPAAEAALLDLIPGHPMAAVAAGLVEAPSPALVDALAQNLGAAERDLRVSSSLALGTASARLAAAEPGRSGAIVEMLLARLARATDVEERVLLLRALGNTGDLRALAVLRLALDDASAQLRAAAVVAVCAIASPEADALIAQTLERDPDGEVRRAAVFAAAARPADPREPRLLRALQRAAELDTSDEVRAAAHRLLT